MSEKALRTLVRFTTENFVAVDSEAVEKVFFLGRGFLDELWKGGFRGFNFPRMRSEIGMQTHEVRLHVLRIPLAANMSIPRGLEVRCPCRKAPRNIRSQKR